MTEQDGWEPTPHKKKRKRKRRVLIETRYIHQPGTMWLSIYDWHRWKWYPDMETAQQALADLQRSVPYQHIRGLRQEYRIPEEYLEDAP